MADLEGFFAKKDKKKAKPKKFVPEEMAQKLEEAEQKQKEKERREELERERLREEQLAKDDPNHKKVSVRCSLLWDRNVKCQFGLIYIHSNCRLWVFERKVKVGGKNGAAMHISFNQLGKLQGGYLKID